MIVSIPSNMWVELYTLTGISVGTQLDAQNIGEADIYLITFPTDPSPGTKGVLIQRKEWLRNELASPGEWAFSSHDGGLLYVVQTPYV